MYIFPILKEPSQCQVIHIVLLTFQLGYISKENLRELLGEDCEEKDIEEMIASMDASRDGKGKPLMTV